MPKSKDQLMPKPRKHERLKPLRTLRIFCEGQQTEPNYLRGYLGTLSNTARKSVVEIERTRKNTAVQLVDEAIKAKKSRDSLPDDEFWVVYDRESTSKYPDALHAQARSKASKAGINIAICNVCFEYWLLIHFVDTDAPYASFQDLLHHSKLNAELKKASGLDYQKSARSIFALVKVGLPVARRRAQRLNAKGRASADQGNDEPHQINPYIGVVELLDAIDAFV